MEAEKSHKLLSANWRMRKSGRMIRTKRPLVSSPQIQRPENLELRKGRRRWSSQPRKRERKFTLPLRLCSLRPSVDWMMPALGKAGLYLVNWSNANLFLKHLPRCIRYSHQLSGHPHTRQVDLWDEMSQWAMVRRVLEVTLRVSAYREKVHFFPYPVKMTYQIWWGLCLKKKKNCPQWFQPLWSEKSGQFRNMDLLLHSH